jgi:hypothetical protein
MPPVPSKRIAAPAAALETTPASTLAPKVVSQEISRVVCLLMFDVQIMPLWNCASKAYFFRIASRLLSLRRAEEPPHRFPPVLQFPRVGPFFLFGPLDKVACRLNIHATAASPAKAQVPSHRDGKAPLLLRRQRRSG